MTTLKLKDIVPDENQPRQYFAADKMHGLEQSIKREGVITPLVVEKVGDKYILIDGERRFRAATKLGLKEVPVIIEPTRSGTERALRQFALQEQHEAWTPIEKALALTRLSSDLKMNLMEVCKLLNISPDNARNYVAFSRLADKEGYLKSEIPLSYAPHMNSARNTARKESSKQLEEEFTKQDEKKLERRIIDDISSGVITDPSMVSKLTFAFIKDPKLVKEYISNAKATPEGLFLKSGAQGAQAMRALMYNANYLERNIALFMKHQDVEVPQELIRRMKLARDAAVKFITQFDE